MVKTGSTKYQKFLKSERAKVKLKKKDLPRGTNITKTNFKIKKIVIREQLKTTDNGQLLSSKKLNIKELMTRLNHFNTSAKLEALSGIKELLAHSSNILDLYMDQLIRSVVSVVMDVERSVRRECFILINTILSSTTSEQLEPFFEILLSYLRCAMTHINQNIQEDSLLFLDVLLECAPFHFVSNYQTVIPNFLDMISKQKIDSKPGRTLTVNLGSKMTSVKWRTKVLSRLHQFLSIMVTSQKNKKENNDERAHLKTTTVSYEEIAPYVNLFRESYLANCILPCFTAQRNNTTLDLSENEAFRSYIEVLLPLLFETWLEVRPAENKNATQNGSILSEEAALLIKNILEVLNLLLMQVNFISEKTKNQELIDFFTISCKQPFIQHILSNFPYIRAKQGQKRMKVETESITDEKMLLENLTICYIFICLRQNKLTSEDHDKIIIQYLQQNLTSFEDIQIQKKYLEVLEKFFSANVIRRKSLIYVETFLNSILSFYAKSNDNLRQQYFPLLCSLFLNPRHEKLCRLRSYENWLKGLPNILLSEKVSIQTVQILNKFAVQCNKSFNESIKGQISLLISNLPKIHKSYGDDASAKCILLSLLYWIKQWDTESLNLLQKQLSNFEYEENNMFILGILKIKTQ